MNVNIKVLNLYKSFSLRTLTDFSIKSYSQLLHKFVNLGEYNDSLHVAPEFYNSETKLASPTTTEQIYVYCLGMTLYSAAEFNCEEVTVQL